MKTQTTTATRHTARGSTSPAPARATVAPKMLRWARERASLEIADLIKTFPKIEEWENGDVAPTLRQLRDFAKRTYTPGFYFYMKEPPEERLPFNDFRTLSKGQKHRFSPNLYDTAHNMQWRCDHLRDERIYYDADPIKYVGSANLRDDPKKVAHDMREALGFADGWASKYSTWNETVRNLRDAIEQIGIMAVINSVVGNSTNRKLDRNEFLGFAICDKYAPLIFVNGADYESSKMFTLAHELAHIWLGAAGEGVSRTKIEDLTPDHKVENFCSKVAAEFLVPAQELHNHWKQVKNTFKPYEALARVFKVSPIIIARRALDEELITRKAFFQFYSDYTAQERSNRKKSVGGDFFNAQNARVGAMFAKTMFYAAVEGRIKYTTLYRLTDLRGATLDRYLRHLGVDV